MRLFLAANCSDKTSPVCTPDFPRSFECRLFAPFVLSLLCLKPRRAEHGLLTSGMATGVGSPVPTVSVMGGAGCSRSTVELNLSPSVQEQT